MATPELSLGLLDEELFVRGAELHEQFLQDSIDMDVAYLKGDLKGWLERKLEREMVNMGHTTISGEQGS